MKHKRHYLKYLFSYVVERKHQKAITKRRQSIWKIDARTVITENRR